MLTDTEHRELERLYRKQDALASTYVHIYHPPTEAAYMRELNQSFAKRIVELETKEREE